MTSTGEQPGIDAPRQIRRWNFWHFLRLPSLSDFNDLKSELRRHDEQCGEIRSLLLEELSVLQKGIASVKQTCLSSAEKQLQSLTELNNLLQALQKFSYGFRSEVQELARTIDTDHRDAQKAMIASQGKIIDESLTHANMVGDRLQHIHLEETRAQLEKMTSLSTALNERIMNTHREFQNKLDAFSALMNQLHESGTTGLSAKISVSQKELSEQFKSMEYTHSQDIVILRREMIQAAAKGNDMLEKLFDAKMSLIEKMTGDVSRAMEIRTSLNREHETMLHSLDLAFIQGTEQREKRLEEQMQTLLRGNESSCRKLSEQAEENSRQIGEIEKECGLLLESLRLLFVNSLIDKINPDSSLFGKK